MRKSSSGTHISQRSLLKTRVREVSEKLGNVFLSAVLVLSLVPTASIAYAADEDPEGTPIEEKASETGGDSGQGGEGQGSDSGQGGEGQGSDSGQGGEGQGSDTVQGGGVVQLEEGGETDQGGDVTQLGEGSAKKAVGAPSLKAMAVDENDFDLIVDVNSAGCTVHNSVAYSQESVSASMSLSCPELMSMSEITVVEMRLPDGVIAIQTDMNHWKLDINKSCSISDIQLVLKPNGTETTETINARSVSIDSPDAVVIDKTGPDITIKFVTSKDSDTAVEKYPVTSDNYNLENNDLYVKITATDNGEINTATSQAMVNWNYDSTGTGTLPERSMIAFEKQDNGDYVGYAGPFNNKDFYVGDDLIVGTLYSIYVEDLAGNSVVFEDEYHFTSESKEVLAALDTVKADAIKVSSDGKSATRDGKTVYNKEVTVSLDGIADSLSIVAKFDGMTLSGSAPYKVTDVKNKNLSHELEFSFTYTSKRKTDKATTKTVTLTKEEAPQLAFDIDMTTPVISVEMNDPSVAATESNPAYYNKENPPKVKVNVENGSTLNTDDPYEFILVKDEEWIPLGKLTADAEGYYTIPNLENDVTYSVRVTPKNIFGETLELNVDQTEGFRVDSSAPTVTLDFSGPGAYADEAGEVAGFFKAWDETEGFEPGTIGKLTVTVEDDNLASVEFKGSVEQKDTDPSSPYTVEIAYQQTEDGLYFGEGDDLTLTVVAIDDAENETTYSYTPGDENTKLPDGSKDAKEEMFVIDLTSVQLAANNVPTADKTIDGVKLFDKSSLSFTVELKDDHFDKANSQILVNGSPVCTGDQWSGDKPNYTGTVEISESSDSARENNLNRVQIVGNDLLGNETLKLDFVNPAAEGYTTLEYGYIALDSKAPELDVSFSGEVKNTKDGIDYYGGEVTATITAKDPWFDKDNSTVNGTAATWTETAEGSGVWKTEITYSEENTYGSPYDFTVEAYDLLDHSSTTDYNTVTGSDGFIIDTTAPTVDVKVSQALAGTVDNVDYYAGPQKKLTATITVSDISFDDASEIIAENSKSISAWTDNEDGTWTATVTFEETEYGKTQSITLDAKDLADNTTAYAYGDNGEMTSTVDAKDAAVNGTSFVIDITQPAIEVSFDQEPVGTATDSDGNPTVDYYDVAPKATITVTDNNFDPKNSPVKPVGGNNDEVYTSWKDNGDGTWTGTIEFGENREGKYENDYYSRLDIRALDKVYTASNGSVADHEQSWTYKDGGASGAPVFVTDLTPPKVSIAISETAKNNFNNLDFYGTVTGGYLTATITVTENNFDKANSSITPTNESPAFTYDTGVWSTNDNKTFTATVTYDESSGISSPSDLAADLVDMVYTVSNGASSDHRTTADYRDDSFKVDASGTATGFIIDLTAPVITGVSVDKSPTSTGSDGSTGGDPIQFFNVATSMTFNIKDINGLSEVSLYDPEGQYTVSKDGTTISKGATAGSFSIELVDGTASSNDTEYERDIELTAIDLAGNARIWTIDRTGKVTSARSESAANVSINGAGVYPWALIKDVTAPVVSLSGPAADSYSNQTQTVSATVNEFNFNYLQRFAGSRAILHITKRAGYAGGPTTSSEVPASLFSGSGSNWSNTQTFAEDGHYTVEASFNDYANNPSNVVRVGEFTIDKTAPVIESIVFDNNNVRNGKYYNAARTATITIIEHNWDDSLAVITSNGSIGGWSHSGDTHVATVYFGTDGDYHLSVSVTDKAGNSAEDKVDDFTIDLTAPRIEFEDVEEFTAYNDIIAPKIIYIDEKNFDQNGIDHTIEGSKHGYEYAGNLAGATSYSGNSATFSFSDFTRAVEYDDIYTIHAHMTDLAGNEAENSITFSVNRFGSNFIIVNAEELKGPRDNGYLPEPTEVLIEEINVSGADSEEHGVSVTHGLDTENLKQLERSNPNGKGFYIEAANDTASWSHYTYHVYKPNFNVDGNYHVVVSSNDYATNMNNSASYYDPEKHEVADAEVSFILDTTDPIIEGLNVTSKTKENAESFDVTFTVTDNIAIDTVIVTLDDEIQSVEPDLNGLCTVTVDAMSFTRRSIDIVATDLAGRSREKYETGFRVTTNIVENYWPAMTATGVAGAGVFIGVKRRKNQENVERVDKVG